MKATTTNKGKQRKIDRKSRILMVLGRNCKFLERNLEKIR